MPSHDLLIRLFAFFVLSANCANNHPACETQRRHFPLVPAIRGHFSSDHHMLSRGRTICFPEETSRKRRALMPKTRGRRGGKNSRASLKSLPRRMRETQSVSERTKRCLVSKPSVRLWGVCLGKWREGNPASPSARGKKNHIPPSLRCVVSFTLPGFHPGDSSLTSQS